MADNNSAQYFDYHHTVTFTDTNSTGNVYFASFFQWMGKCREILTEQHYPELVKDLEQGFGFATEFAHIDYIKDCFLFEHITVRLYIADFSKIRIEFRFEFINEKDSSLCATGKQAVVWVNSQHRPSLMPDKLYESAVEYFNIKEQKEGLV